VGPASTMRPASTISADLYLLTCTGIHEKAGLTTEDADQAALQRIFISRAADTYVLGSLDKIGTAAPYTITGLSDVAGIVTDAPTYDPTIQRLRQQGVNIIQAPESHED
jgi:DeoR/GlpR family transcriptional regulator of sugar metabolism